MFKIANGEAGDFSLWTAPAWPLIHVQFSKTKEFLFGEKKKGVETIGRDYEISGYRL